MRSQYVLSLPLWRPILTRRLQEFLLFALPLINTRAIRRQMSALTTRITLSSLLPAPVRALTGSLDPARAEGSVRRGRYWSLPEEQCAICADNASTKVDFSEPANALATLGGTLYNSSGPTTTTDPDDPDHVPQFPIHTPYITSCGHIYCYYCVTERMMRTCDERSGVGPKGVRWECLRCGDGVADADRLEAEAEGPEYESGVDDDDDDDASALTFDYGSDDVEFTDMSGSMGGSYADSESGRSSD